MPTEHSPSGRGQSHESEHVRLLREKSKGIILSIRPTTEADARKWLGACNRLNANQEVTEHFAEEVRRLA